MSNGFQTAKKTLDLSATNLSSFNEPVSGTKFFAVGTHKAKIADAEMKDYGYGENVLITWEGENGETIKQFIPFFYVDKKTKEQSISKGYIILAHSLASTIETRRQYFLKMVSDDNTILSALKGLQANIVIAQGKKGVDIVAEPVSGGFNVIDVATKEKLLDPTFLSYADASQAAKDAGLKRAYNEITTIRNSKEEVLANEKLLRIVIETAEKTPATASLQRANML